MPSADADPADATSDPRHQLDIWAASGAMALTGRPDAPLGPPAGLVPKLEAVAGLLRSRSAALGNAVVVDAVALLGERAAVAGLSPQGSVSCGGATRLLRAADGWFALTLARQDDIELVAPWLERAYPDEPAWEEIASATATRTVGALVARGRLLGLPIAALGDARPVAGPGRVAPPSLPIMATPLAGGPATGRMADVVVADLSSLWAGPLCGSLLAAAGAEVVKVESSSRPDGARGGPRGFFDLLNAAKRGFAVDFRSRDGVRALRALVEQADVVIEGSRPRALEQLGIDAADLVARGRPRVWVSITGYGRSGPERDRIAFGDDAAVAGALVAWEDGVPRFCADAIADPGTGLVAAAGALDALSAGGRWLLDVPMASVAAHLAGPTLPVRGGTSPAPPRHRAVTGRGPALGEHTAEVLGRLGIR